ncbi:hypothetical protein N7495_006577 [Penicillium taxi]|uniref:uncharacterized protein n=1 Tax=Penicillium taxi TaxID=168475 RepID=UPI0025458FC6|nr:uncharacterized protein N7495_006577 [Penicillium taxi]KAJ5894886.1 hypothetical protein N7495_006577 [Penicillium taxi]
MTFPRHYQLKRSWIHQEKYSLCHDVRGILCGKYCGKYCRASVFSSLLRNPHILHVWLSIRYIFLDMSVYIGKTDYETSFMDYHKR